TENNTDVGMDRGKDREIPAGDEVSSEERNIQDGRYQQNSQTSSSAFCANLMLDTGISSVFQYIIVYFFDSHQVRALALLLYEESGEGK
ncbi:unnamed protein product, partial [marine sediment metagenome]